MANTEFVVNALRHEPYLGCKFRLKMDGRYVAGVSKISALDFKISVVKFRNGNSQSISSLNPSVTEFTPITMERGVTHDKDFENWAKLAFNILGDASMSLNNFRKDINIELMNEQGVPALRYKIYRCWVSEFQALPELDANTNAVAIQKIVVQNEGWERDEDLPEPKQT